MRNSLVNKAVRHWHREAMDAPSLGALQPGWMGPEHHDLEAGYPAYGGGWIYKVPKQNEGRKGCQSRTPHLSCSSQFSPAWALPKACNPRKTCSTTGISTGYRGTSAQHLEHLLFFLSFFPSPVHCIFILSLTCFPKETTSLADELNDRLSGSSGTSYVLHGVAL